MMRKAAILLLIIPWRIRVPIVTPTPTPTRMDNHNPFRFVDLKYAPDLQQTSARLRSPRTSELSALFAIYQVHVPMRVSPIVSRTFCWANTYEAAEINYKMTPPVSLKAVTQTHFRILLDCIISQMQGYWVRCTLESICVPS